MAALVPPNTPSMPLDHSRSDEAPWLRPVWGAVRLSDFPSVLTMNFRKRIGKGASTGTPSALQPNQVLRYSSRGDSAQVRSDRFAQLVCCRRATQVRGTDLPRCQHLLNGTHERRRCLLFAKMVEQELA